MAFDGDREKNDLGTAMVTLPCVLQVAASYLKIRRTGTFVHLIAVLIPMAVGLTFSAAPIACGYDRTFVYLPLSPQPLELSTADKTMSISGVRPDLAAGAARDSDWAGYMGLWKRHHDNPADATIRRVLRLPSGQATQIVSRQGRSAPGFLGWRAGTFRIVQTPHFTIYSRSDEAQAKSIAEDLERVYWVWTQVFFPLWSGRDQASLILEKFRSAQPNSRPITPFQSLKRHQVVLLRNADEYRSSISRPGVNAGNLAAISASSGFYSDAIQTTFCFPQNDRSSLHHEVCHQLFFEATDRKTSTIAMKSTQDFWLVEGIAGHFESVRFGQQLATLGGWDSDRLQYARYRTLIGNQPLASIQSLQGTRAQCQRRSDLMDWYAQAILHTHLAMDASSTRSGEFPTRARLIAQLADIYRIRMPQTGSSENSVDQSGDMQADATKSFLLVDDATIKQHPVTGDAGAICLAGTTVSKAGWEDLPPFPSVRWFDASRTSIDDSQVQRLVTDPESLTQLSLEATDITPSIAGFLERAVNLRELDLSWTAIDDSVVRALAASSKLETLWLTGSQIGDSSIPVFANLPNLKTIDLQRTSVSSNALGKLQSKEPELQINPLKLPQ